VMIKKQVLTAMIKYYWFEIIFFIKMFAGVSIY
jgi:hypothetical protein